MVGQISIGWVKRIRLEMRAACVCVWIFGWVVEWMRVDTENMLPVLFSGECR